MKLNFRLLKANEIDVRVGQITQSGATLLLYKNARTDMDILDEVVGPMNWMREHSRDNANCIVSIWDDEKNCWVSKEDTGTESNTEKEKGLASDSFKRACTNWGIGRELYTAGRIFVKCPTSKNSNGKGYVLDNPYQFYGVEVTQINYNGNREIVGLEICDENGKRMFGKGLEKANEPTKITSVDVKTTKRTSKSSEVNAKSSEVNAKLPKVITDSDVKNVESLAKATRSDVAGICGYFKVKSIKEMTQEQYANCISILERKKAALADEAQSKE